MNKQKIKIGKSLVFKAMFVASLLMLMISISYSWFVETNTSKMSGVGMDVAENSNLLLQGEGGSWQKNLHFQIPDGFTFPPVTGNGTHMYEAVFKESERAGENGFVYYEPVFSHYAKLSDEGARNSVISCRFSMKVEENYRLCLSPSSFIRPKVEHPTVAGTSIRDGYMYAALRVAFMQLVDGEYQTKMIWIPDVTTELKQSSDGSYWVDRGGEVESSVFVDEQGNEYTINENGDHYGTYLRPEDGILYAWGALPDDVTFGELIGNEKSDFQIVIWLDGNDRECREVAILEKFEVNVTFNAIDKQEPTE